MSLSPAVSLKVDMMTHMSSSNAPFRDHKATRPFRTAAPPCRRSVWHQICLPGRMRSAGRLPRSCDRWSWRLRYRQRWRDSRYGANVPCSLLACVQTHCRRSAHPHTPHLCSCYATPHGLHSVWQTELSIVSALPAADFVCARVCRWHLQQPA